MARTCIGLYTHEHHYTSASKKLKISVVASKPLKLAKENTPSQVQPCSTLATMVATKSSTQAPSSANCSQPLQKLKMHTASSHSVNNAELATLQVRIANQQGDD